jgi:hypothetical protein
VYIERALLESCYAVEELARRGGQALSDADRKLLSRMIRTGTITWRGGVQEGPSGELAYRDALLSPDLSEPEVARLSPILVASFHGFFDAAADGLPLTQVSAVIELMGRTVNTAYPGAGRAFNGLAVTYWTLNALARAGSAGAASQIAVTVLDRIRSLVEPLFFRPAGDFRSPRQRIEDQRKALRAFGRRFNEDDFLRGNPS